MKILHTADIHIQNNSNERWFAFKQILNLCKAEKIEILIIAGDLFDSHKSALNLIDDIRSILKNTNFKIIILPGNHDCKYYDEGFFFSNNVTILNNFDIPFKIKTENEIINIWGIPYKAGSDTDKKIKTTLDLLNILKIQHDKIITEKKSFFSHRICNVLLYHGELLDSFYSKSDFGDESNQRYMPVQLKNFKMFDFDYVLAGHFHTKFDVKQINPNKYFVYSGSPVSITVKESGQRKVNIFNIFQPPAEKVIDTLFYEKIDISFNPFSFENPKSIIENKIKSISSNAIPLLTLSGFINFSNFNIDVENQLTEENLAIFAVYLLEKNIKEKFKSKFVFEYNPESLVNIEYKDVSNVYKNPLFIKFIEKLEEDNLTETDLFDESTKSYINNETVKEYVINSFRVV